MLVSGSVRFSHLLTVEWIHVFQVWERHSTVNTDLFQVLDKFLHCEMMVTQTRGLLKIWSKSGTFWLCKKIYERDRPNMCTFQPRPRSQHV